MTRFNIESQNYADYFRGCGKRIHFLPFSRSIVDRVNLELLRSIRIYFLVALQITISQYPNILIPSTTFRNYFVTAHEVAHGS